MSLGFIPVIISILLCEFIAQDISIYIGTAVGLFLWGWSWRYKGARIPQFLLYSTTGMLVLLSIAALFTANYCPASMFPLTLEVSVIIPPLVIYLNRKRFLNNQVVQARRGYRQFSVQGAEAAIVSARVVLIISILHFLIILCTFLINRSFGTTAQYILFNIAPLAVFILSILFNQFGIHYFNLVMRHTVFVPMVNKKGHVLGKAMAVEAMNKKNDYINPVIRIAVASHGMLFLSPRPQHLPLDKGKIDLLIEDYLLYGENLEQGVKRILHQTLPTAPLSDLHFNFMYHFENEMTNRLVYVFTLDLEDDSILYNNAFDGGKLWTFRQIKHNLNRHFFSQCFEHEYDHLKTIIYTREKYKEF